MIFFRTVAESLKSFRETYGIGHPLPNAQSNEVQFVVAVVGVVVNITTIAEGRKMILDSNEGRELIEEMINLTCELSVSGKYIQRYAGSLSLSCAWFLYCEIFDESAFLFVGSF